jgi:hypothetical protein
VLQYSMALLRLRTGGGALTQTKGNHSFLRSCFFPLQASSSFNYFIFQACKRPRRTSRP